MLRRSGSVYRSQAARLGAPCRRGRGRPRVEQRTPLSLPQLAIASIVSAVQANGSAHFRTFARHRQMVHHCCKIICCIYLPYHSQALEALVVNSAPPTCAAAEMSVTSSLRCASPGPDPEYTATFAGSPQDALD